MLTIHDGDGPRAVSGDVHGHPGVVLYDTNGDPVTGGGGGGGAVTVADGADVTQGAKADAAVTDPTLSASEIALLKGLLSGLGATGDAATANTVVGRLKKLISLFPTALGGTTAAGSLPVVLSSDGPFATNFGLTTDGESSSGNASAIAIFKRLRTLLAGGLPAALGAGGGLKVDGSGTALPVSQNGTWTVQPGNTANTTAWLTKAQRAATPSQSSVASSASNGTLLASNSNRLGATIYNDSTAVLYLKLGTTASATSFSVAMAAGSYYEVPFNYTGQIDGIWASANGNARITELT